MFLRFRWNVPSYRFDGLSTKVQIRSTWEWHWQYDLHHGPDAYRLFGYVLKVSELHVRNQFGLVKGINGFLSSVQCLDFGCLSACRACGILCQIVVKLIGYDHEEQVHAKQAERHQDERAG